MLLATNLSKPARTSEEATATVQATEPTTRSAVITCGLAALREDADLLYGFGIKEETPPPFRLISSIGHVIGLTPSWWMLIAGLETNAGSTWDRACVEEHLPAGTYTVYAWRD